MKCFNRYEGMIGLFREGEGIIENVGYKWMTYNKPPYV